VSAHLIAAIVLGTLVIIILAGLGQLLHDVQKDMAALQRSMDRIETKLDELLRSKGQDA
jgi:uncharacterized protein YoxC